MIILHTFRFFFHIPAIIRFKRLLSSNFQKMAVTSQKLSPTRLKANDRGFRRRSRSFCVASPIVEVKWKKNLTVF